MRLDGTYANLSLNNFETRKVFSAKVQGAEKSTPVEKSRPAVVNRVSPGVNPAGNVPSALRSELALTGRQERTASGSAAATENRPGREDTSLVADLQMREGSAQERFSQPFIEAESVSSTYANAQERFQEEQTERLSEESTQKDLNEVISEMNGEAELDLLSLRFRLHEDSSRWMVQIYDIMDREVVREIPPEQVLDLSARIKSTVGVLVDARG